MISSSPRDQRCTVPPRLTSCGADAVPLPFDQPVRRVAERSRSDPRAATRGRTDTAATGRRPCARCERSDGEPLGRRRPVAHEPGGDRRRRQAGGLGERADDERLRDADAELAGEELEQDEALQAVERPPPGRDALLLRRRIEPLAAAGCAPRPSARAAGPPMRASGS